MDVKKKRPRREKMATTKPRDAIVVEHILNQMGAEHFEPRVVNQGLEFIYRYVGDVLEEAKVYQRHRIGYDVANNEGRESLVDGGDGGEAMMMNLEEMKKNSVSVKDVRLASRVILAREFAANDASGFPQFSSYVAATSGSKSNPLFKLSLPVATNLPFGGRFLPLGVHFTIHPSYPPLTPKTCSYPNSFCIFSATWHAIVPSAHASNNFAEDGFMYLFFSFSVNCSIVSVPS